MRSRQIILLAIAAVLFGFASLKQLLGAIAQEEAGAKLFPALYAFLFLFFASACVAIAIRIQKSDDRRFKIQSKEND